MVEQVCLLSCWVAFSDVALFHELDLQQIAKAMVSVGSVASVADACHLSASCFEVCLAYSETDEVSHLVLVALQVVGCLLEFRFGQECKLMVFPVDFRSSYEQVPAHEYFSEQ